MKSQKLNFELSPQCFMKLSCVFHKGVLLLLMLHLCTQSFRDKWRNVREPFQKKAQFGVGPLKVTESL